MNKTVPSLQSHIISIAQLCILQEFGRLVRCHTVHDQFPGAVEGGRGIYVLVRGNPLVKSLMAGEFLDRLLSELKLVSLSLNIHIHISILIGDQTVRQTMHQRRYVVVVTVLVATVVVVPDNVEQESLSLQGSPAVFALDLCDCLGNGALDQVQAPVREVIRARHR